MNLIFIIIFIIAITALVIGSLAYTKQPDSKFLIYTDKNKWANIGAFGGQEQDCVCEQLPYPGLPDWACNTNNIIADPYDTNQTTSCYDSQQDCGLAQCGTDKIGYSRVNSQGPGGYCNCSANM